VRPFVEAVAAGRSSPERIERVVRSYEAIGGASPFNALTLDQARALGEELAARGLDLPVQVGLRHSAPSIADTLAAMHAQGHRRLLVLVMAVHRNRASWDAYLGAVTRAIEAIGAGSIDAHYLEGFSTHPRFVEACAARAREATAGLEPERLARAWLVFTAHAIPRALADASEYDSQIHETSRLVARALGREVYRVAYQSRASMSEPWTEPDINDAIQEAARIGSRDVVVCPVGFLCDHVEVLFDLDVTARATARDGGLTLWRAPTVGTHPLFIGMLGDLIAARLDAGRP
jgi:ferrochelatase